jgi:hypothetical protein
MKLWVDDVRVPPGTRCDDYVLHNPDWIWAKSSSEAISCLRYLGPFTEMSLDHDLGGEDTTRDIILQMCDGQIPWPDKVVVHSANVVGREWLKGMIERYQP